MILSGICKRDLKKRLANLSKKLPLFNLLFCTLVQCSVLHMLILLPFFSRLGIIHLMF
jgi:hypothetical protein